MIYVPLETGEKVKFDNIPDINSISFTCSGEDSYQITQINGITDTSSINNTITNMILSETLTFENGEGKKFNSQNNFTLETDNIVIIQSNRFIIGSVTIDSNTEEGNTEEGNTEEDNTVDVCLLKGTMIYTDQGKIPVERINGTHTVNNYKVKAVTKGTFFDNIMVRIEKDTFGENIPFEDTYVTPYHSLYLNRKFIIAGRLVNKINGISFVTMAERPMVYNILFEKWLVITANGIPMESLHPQSDIIIKSKSKENITYF